MNIVIVDSRVRSKGFWVYVDGHPGEMYLLESILKDLCSKGLSFEQIYEGLIQGWIEYIYPYPYSKYRSPMPPDVNKKFGILTPEQVKVAKKSGVKGLLDRFGIDVVYIYHIRQDGVYVTSFRILEPVKIE